MAILQISAWSWMIASYSQESSIEQAIRDTFGDERPQELCLFIDSTEAPPSGENAPYNSGKDPTSLLLIPLSKAAEHIWELPTHTPGSPSYTKPRST